MKGKKVRANFKPISYRSPSYVQPLFTRTSQPNTQTKKPDSVESPKQLQTTPYDYNHSIIAYNQFRFSIAILRTASVLRLMDYLEWTENKNTVPDNGVMGTKAIELLANLDVNDDRWKKFDDNGIHFPSHLRPKIKEAACQVLKMGDLLVSYITGEDHIFSNDEVINWLYKNPVTLAMIGQGQQYYEFQNAMKVLNMKNNLKMMDYLEWHYDHSKAQPSNGRFGTWGIQLLSNLTVDSPLWEKMKIYENHRKQEAINAAKIAMKPSNATLLFQTHGGDGIYDQDEMKKWLEWNI